VVGRNHVVQNPVFIDKSSAWFFHCIVMVNFPKIW
jgi:hypothetical protein